MTIFIIYWSIYKKKTNHKNIFIKNMNNRYYFYISIISVMNVIENNMILIKFLMKTHKMYNKNN